MCYCGQHQAIAPWSHCVMHHCAMCIAIRYAVIFYPNVPVICESCRPFFGRLSQLLQIPIDAMRMRVPNEHDVCSACSLKIDVIYLLGRQLLVECTLCYACAKFLLENFF